MQRRSDALRQQSIEATASVGDLTVPSDARRVFAESESALGPIDILVNAAGLAQTGVESPIKRVADLTVEDWQRELDVNLMTAVHLTSLVLPGMAQRGYGRIVMISSITGPVVAAPQLAGYAPPRLPWRD